jgi:hypothetical protein
MNGNPLEMAANADVIVVCVSELPSTELPGNIYDLELPKAQQDYVKMLQSTLKPVVLVLVENRPRIVRELVDGCSAVVMAYQLRLGWRKEKALKPYKNTIFHPIRFGFTQFAFGVTQFALALSASPNSL